MKYKIYVNIKNKKDIFADYIIDVSDDILKLGSSSALNSTNEHMGPILKTYGIKKETVKIIAAVEHFPYGELPKPIWWLYPEFKDFYPEKSNIKTQLYWDSFFKSVFGNRFSSVIQEDLLIDGYKVKNVQFDQKLNNWSNNGYYYSHDGKWTLYHSHCSVVGGVGHLVVSSNIFNNNHHAFDMATHPMIYLAILDYYKYMIEQPLVFDTCLSFSLKYEDIIQDALTTKFKWWHFIKTNILDNIWARKNIESIYGMPIEQLNIPQFEIKIPKYIVF